MENNSISNNKFLILAIVFISIVAFCAFLIGYGVNDGTCPVCKDKTVVKVFTTINNIEDSIDYNMVTSEIKKDLIGKYTNESDKKSYLEIYKDGNFKLVLSDCTTYTEYTNDDFVLLLYYRKEVEENTASVNNDSTIEESSTMETAASTNYQYYTMLTLIPKSEIEGDLLTAKMLTFSDSVYTKDGISLEFIGPSTCGDSNLYKKGTDNGE